MPPLVGWRWVGVHIAALLVAAVLPIGLCSSPTSSSTKTFGGQRMPFRAAAPSAAPSTLRLPSLDLIPRDDWISVKTMGAKGDGSTDDSAAIQRALDLISGCHDKALMNTTAYFPPGRYKLSKGLVLCGISGFFDLGFNVLGHGASCEPCCTLPRVLLAHWLAGSHCRSLARWLARSLARSLWLACAWLDSETACVQNDARAAVLVWAGESNGTMLRDNGTTYGSIAGLVFDGGNVAGVGLWHNSHNKYGSMMLHENLAFQNLTWAGMMTAQGGGKVMATAEVRIRNCIFSKTHYGVYLKEYNDYDTAISGCHFTDQQIGVYSPHGNFDARDCRFERSNVSDLYFGAIPSGVHRIVSVNSTMFAIGGGWCACPASFAMNDCHVIGWKGSAKGGWWDAWAPLPAIGLAFRGPLSVFDSTFVSVLDTDLPPAAMVQSWTPQQSWEISGHTEYGTHDYVKTYNETHYFGRDIIVGNNIYTTGPLVQEFPQDRVNYVNLTNSVPRAPIGASTQFLRTWWPTATKVFDVKSFGNASLIGSGSNNDTSALLHCIASAASAGNGAVCYLPPGVYVTTSTLVLSGSNFSVEGAGMRTQLAKHAANVTEWPAAANGSLFEISSTVATDVTIRQLQPESKEPGSPIVYMGPPAKSDLPRTLRLDYLLAREAPMSVPCPDPDPKKHLKGCGAYGDRCSSLTGCIDTAEDRSLRVALVFEGLSASDTILIDTVESGQYWKDSSAATYLRNCGSGWTVIESPRATALEAARRSACEGQAVDAAATGACAVATAGAAAVSLPGFFGELMVFNSGNAYGLTVRDGQSYVSDYFYTESTDRIVHLGPGSGAGSGGVVTMTGTKSSTTNEDMMHVDRFVGNFTLLKSNIQMQGQPTTTPPWSFQLKGALPAGSNLMFFGNQFANNPPSLTMGGGGHVYSLSNVLSFDAAPTEQDVAWCLKLGEVYPGATDTFTQGNTCSVKDTPDPEASALVRQAFDHKLLLGQWDLYHNHPEVMKIALKSDDATSNLENSEGHRCRQRRSTQLQLAERFADEVSLELRLPASACHVTRVHAAKDATLTVTASALMGTPGLAAELIHAAEGVVSPASAWQHACGVVAVVVSVPYGMVLEVTNTEVPIEPAECSDGVDNDEDGLVDWPLDPGCDDPADDEGGDLPPDLTYEFNETDGRLKNLNWTSHRIVWDEVGRIGTLDPKKQPKQSWNRLDTSFWFHGMTCHCGYGCGCGSDLKIRPHPQSNYTEIIEDRVGVDMSTKFVSADPSTYTVVVQTDTPTLKIVDTVHFAGTTMYISMAMTNKNFTSDGEPISAQIPVYLGSLALGSFLQNGTTNEASPGVWVLNPGAGGWNQSLDRCGSSNPKVKDGCMSAGGSSYPNNDAFSPVLVLADSRVTTGFSFLGADTVVNTAAATMSMSVNKRLSQTNHGSGHPGGLLGATGMIGVTFVNRTINLTLAVSFAKSTSDDSAWEAALAPYSKDFNTTVGGVRYCPTGPFFELAVVSTVLRHSSKLSSKLGSSNASR
jgi:hypothetical protein